MGGFCKNLSSEPVLWHPALKMIATLKKQEQQLNSNLDELMIAQKRPQNQGAEIVGPIENYSLAKEQAEETSLAKSQFPENMR